MKEHDVVIYKGRKATIVHIYKMNSNVIEIEMHDTNKIYTAFKTELKKETNNVRKKISYYKNHL